MAQNLIQTQAQRQVQQQKLTQQQMLAVHLLEMPLTELEQSVEAELDDNPALEGQDPDAPEDGTQSDSASDDGAQADGDGSGDGDDDGDFDARQEREERESALDDALSNIGMDDAMPEATVPTTQGAQGSADYEETVYGDQVSFYDRLKEQMAELELTPKQREVMEYVIGSLDDDGLLRKKDDDLCDELAIYHGIDVSEEEMAEIVSMLQGFDPAGIGAHDLRECLLLQIRRKEPSALRTEMERVIVDCFDEFKNRRWDKISARLGIDEQEAGRVRAELLRLNPKPGASLGETEGRNMQQITPDFIVDTADDGTVTFTINTGRMPELRVSPTFADLLRGYQKKGRANLTRGEKEAVVYAKEKVDRAQGFIDAVKQRQRTLQATMKAIIDIQRDYFRDGDEADLKPMILKDVADRAKLDISTVSRVSNMKYAQTRWGTFRLRHFFSDGLKTDDGEELSTRRIKAALQDIVDKEDKAHPLSDDAIKDRLQAAGLPVARRTVAKYREQLGIPVARLRKR